MLSVILDEENYYTGQFSTVGNLDGSIEVDKIPNVYDSVKKQCCYKYNNGNWEFDNIKYQALLDEEDSTRLNELKEEKIKQSKTKLSNYLETATITSSCHKGEINSYSITSEKQQHLANMILTTTMAAQVGIPYQPSWNASGEPCTYDWTLEELQQLAMEIEAVVRPLVSKQQQLEVTIRNASTLEEIKAINIEF